MVVRKEGYIILHEGEDVLPPCFGTDKDDKDCRKCKHYSACCRKYAQKLLEGL